MNLLSWFDNRTLLSCQIILAAVFAVLFYGMRRAYPTFRGVGSIALCCALGVPGILLLFLRSVAPDILSITVGNLLVLSSFTLYYRGILRFLGDEHPITFVWLIDLAAIAVLFYYSEVRPNLVPRVIVASLAIAIIRVLTGLKLLQHAKGRISMLLFGLSMMLYALISVSRIPILLVNGPPQNYIDSYTFLTFTLVGDIIYICLVGLFFMNMINDRILAIVRNESEHDPVSGVLNRRGIEHRLSVEGKRIERSKAPLSIALIDIDNFKTINDTVGHTIGDDAIRLIAHAISGRLRAYDHFGRYGGDEFLLLLPQTSAKDAQTVVERFAQIIRQLSCPGINFPLTLSIGLTEAIPGETALVTLARADKALYAAKHAGRDCSRIQLHETMADISALSVPVELLATAEQPDSTAKHEQGFSQKILSPAQRA